MFSEVNIRNVRSVWFEAICQVIGEGQIAEGTEVKFSATGVDIRFKDDIRPEAIEALGRHLQKISANVFGPDVVVVETQMPKKTGVYEFAREVHNPGFHRG